MAYFIPQSVTKLLGHDEIIVCVFFFNYLCGYIATVLN